MPIKNANVITIMEAVESQPLRRICFDVLEKILRVVVKKDII